MTDLYTWLGIIAVVLTATAGDVLTSRAMKDVGDVGDFWRHHGVLALLRRVGTHPTMWIGVAFMAMSFFSLLYALSWGAVSLVAPASASLTFLSNAVAAKFFLHEKVDKRRWAAALLVAGGVALVAA